MEKMINYTQKTYESELLWITDCVSIYQHTTVTFRNMWYVLDTCPIHWLTFTELTWLCRWHRFSLHTSVHPWVWRRHTSLYPYLISICRMLVQSMRLAVCIWVQFRVFITLFNVIHADDLTIADFQLITATMCLEAIDFDIRNYPLVLKWYKTFKEEYPELWEIAAVGMKEISEFEKNPPDLSHMDHPIHPVRKWLLF